MLKNIVIEVTILLNNFKQNKGQKVPFKSYFATLNTLVKISAHCLVISRSRL